MIWDCSFVSGLHNKWWSKKLNKVQRLLCAAGRLFWDCPLASWNSQSPYPTLPALICVLLIINISWLCITWGPTVQSFEQKTTPRAVWISFIRPFMGELLLYVYLHINKQPYCTKCLCRHVATVILLMGSSVWCSYGLCLYCSDKRQIVSLACYKCRIVVNSTVTNYIFTHCKLI